MRAVLLQRFSKEFLLRWVETQFAAWRRAKAVTDGVEAPHPDAKKAFGELPDAVKMFIFSLIPAQLGLFISLGRGRLVCLRDAGQHRNRVSVSNLIDSLAARYHDEWCKVRELQRELYTTPPKERDDDVPWNYLSDKRKDEVREIIWQLSIALAHDVSPVDFQTLFNQA